MENGEITIARAHSSITFPACFQFVGAMNPCRCGNLMDNGKKCSKAPICAQEYQAKISGPLLDRIDITIEVPRIDIFNKTQSKGETSSEVKKRVVKARQIQQERYGSSVMTNATMNNSLIEKYAKLNTECKNIIQKAMNTFGMSIRSYTKVIKVARTIADMSSSENIEKIHLLEALRYRKTESII
jgi:magnesium chelatase family protein